MREKIWKRSVSAVAIATAMALSPAFAQTAPGERRIEPYWGDIAPFYGAASPFRGDIAPFWGDIAPFWGDIAPFWGDIAPFWGDIAPFWGDIAPFWGDIAPFWGDIAPFMDGLQTLPSGSNPSALLDGLLSRSEDFWGPTVQAATGESFRAGFASDLFQRFGLGQNGEGFQALSTVDRARFLFAWYDGLMAFSGRDHVDYWMGNVNWSPSLSQKAGAGAGVTIGLFDFTVTDGQSTGALSGSRFTGYASTNVTHGDAVAGLLVAAYDGVGPMGIAPRAALVNYNPFDATGTASWSSIADGIKRLKQSGASVVNLSLGVAGAALAPEWAGVYTHGNVRNILGSLLFVHAAGNSGVTQTANIPWNFSLNPSILVVGSVGPSGEISAFSNRPGQACLLNNGVCQERLMNRFLVAPGEWILVSDGQGGVTRMSGTSFAAPQVAGAAALLQSRWPWLRERARETADILLNSAQDLGAPGVDPVYGRGMLDIAAAQSPLNMRALYQRTTSGQRISLSPTGGSALLGAQSGYVVVYEDIGSTFRDFIVPLNSTLAPTTFVTDSLRAYVSTLRAVMPPSTTTNGSGSSTKQKRRFEDEFGMALANPFGLDLRLRIGARAAGLSQAETDLPYTVDLMLVGDGAAMFAGHGSGALALTGSSEAAAMDYAGGLGGADPLLGLASGGAYAAAEVALGAGLSLTAGFTMRDAQAVQTNPLTGEEQPLFAGIAPYRAAAGRLQVRADLNDSLAIVGAYTYLREEDGLLGLQSPNPEAFQEGAQTDAATFGVLWKPSDQVSVSASASYGRSREQAANAQALAVGADGLETSAYEATLSVLGVFADRDVARLRLAQPLHVERGVLNVTNLEVVDRETGALGPVSQAIRLGAGARRQIVEGLYATPVLDERAELGLFARIDASPAAAEPVEEIVGASFRFKF